LVTGNLRRAEADTARRLADVVQSGRNDIDGFDGLVAVAGPVGARWTGQRPVN
jgi:hypothetical protein